MNDIVKEVKLTVPAWFRFEPGFAWFDQDGHFCMLLGYASEHQVMGDTITVQAPGDVSYVAECYSYAPAVVFVYWYKNTWYTDDLNVITAEMWAASEPCPPHHTIRGRLGEGTTFKHMTKDCE